MPLPILGMGLSALKNWKLFAAIGLIAALGLGLGYMYMNNQITNLKDDAIVLEQQKKDLAIDLGTATQVNHSNKIVIERMREADKDRQDAATRLNKTLKLQAKRIEVLDDYIENIEPEENGPVAAVLMNTIDTIQTMQKEE